jgi:Beta-propeller repeat
MRYAGANALLVIASLVAFNVIACSSQTLDRKTASPSSPLLVKVNFPIGFESNVGQFPTEARYISRGPGYNLFLTSPDAVFEFGSRISSGPLRLRLRGANPSVKPEGKKLLSSYSNYLIGNDPRGWHKHVPQFEEVWYSDIYPGVDLVYYGSSGRLEYDFVVAPYASADRIAFSIAGLEGGQHLRKNAKGDLIIPVGEKEVSLHKPRLYQGDSCLHQNSNLTGSAHPSCRAIAGGRFRVGEHDNSGAHVGFELPAYDHSQPLIIDPVISFSTFLGGSLGAGADGMAVDSSGDIYLIGGTNSNDFPMTSAAFQNALAGDTDAFVSKLSEDGSHLIFSTYLGGSNSEFPHGIAVDSSGNSYLTGETNSTDFPLVTPYQSQNLGGGSGFISKLSADGSTLVFSTYLGGNSESSSTGIAVDSSGETVVTGWTYATNFPIVNPFQGSHASDGGVYDAFVTKFSSDGSSLIFSTYLGGNSADLAEGVSLDPSGNIYVAGMTNSSNFPTTSGAYQSTYVSNPWGSSFVSKFSPTGTSLLYSTYLPASQTFAVAVNASGNAFLTGFTGEYGFPVTTGAFQTVEGGGSSVDAFVTEFDTTGSSLVYSTYLGGNNEDYGYAIALDSAGDAYVTGTTVSLNFPLEDQVESTAYAGVYDAFVSEFNSSGSQLLFSTYLGGGADGSGDSQGNAIAVDSSGNIYVAGSTTAPDFPVLNAMQSTLTGAGDAFITKFLNQPPPVISVSSSTVSFAPAVVTVPSPQQLITLTNVGVGVLAVTSIVINGDFSETNTCSSGLAPQATCTIQITFTPTVFGARTGQLTVSSNATLLPEIVQLSGTGQDFMLEGTPGKATVSAGQTASYSVTLTPEAGFAQTISFSCAGTPLNSTCSVSPASVTLDGTNNSSATLTVATSSSSAGLIVPTRYFAGQLLPAGGFNATGGGFRAMLALCFVALLVLCRAKKAAVCYLSVVVLGSLLVACGNTVTQGGRVGSGTPLGTYNVTVTGTTVGGLNHGAIFTLTVN